MTPRIMLDQPRPKLILFAAALLALLLWPATASAQSWLPSSPYPAWAMAMPSSVTLLNFDPALSEVQNGQRLHDIAEALQPGEGLSVGPGVWSVNPRFDMSVVGTANQPVWIFATDPSNRPIITRPNNLQNCLNIGSVGSSRYLVLQNLEFTGGSDLIRVYDGSFLWIDGCYVHDGDGIGIAVQTVSCSNVFVTRNEIARPGPGTVGEGIYFGANFGTLQVTDSVVAFNRVYDTRGAVAGQGDGIEIKQGSTRNWIVGNEVHGCQNPCILVYGTGGVDENVIEGNLCYDSDDVVLQVQGEAIVRNNVAIGGTRAFSSFDHQGTSQNLQLIHNTFVNDQRSCELSRWGGRPGMVFANNACYSTGADSLYFGIGDLGVLASGNVLFGPSNHTGPGYRGGGGLDDFANVDLQTFAVDVEPVVGRGLDGFGDPVFATVLDQALQARSLPVDVGARTSARALAADTATVPFSGGVQNLSFDAGAGFAGAVHVLAASTLGGGGAGSAGVLTANGFTVPLVPDWLFLASITGQAAAAIPNGIGQLDANGRAATAIIVPPLGPAAAGLAITSSMIVIDGGLVTYVSNSVGLVLQ